MTNSKPKPKPIRHRIADLIYPPDRRWGVPSVLVEDLRKQLLLINPDNPILSSPLCQPGDVLIQAAAQAQQYRQWLDRADSSDMAIEEVHRIALWLRDHRAHQIKQGYHDGRLLSEVVIAYMEGKERP